MAEEARGATVEGHQVMERLRAVLARLEEAPAELQSAMADVLESALRIYELLIAHQTEGRGGQEDGCHSEGGR